MRSVAFVVFVCEAVASGASIRILGRSELSAVRPADDLRKRGQAGPRESSACCFGRLRGSLPRMHRAHQRAQRLKLELIAVVLSSVVLSSARPQRSPRSRDIVSASSFCATEVAGSSTLVVAAAAIAAVVWWHVLLRARC